MNLVVVTFKSHKDRSFEEQQGVLATVETTDPRARKVRIKIEPSACGTKESLRIFADTLARRYNVSKVIRKHMPY